MEGFLHQIFSGLANGIIYGSVALALVMIYQATHHINFAQGEMATFSTFIAWWLMQQGWPYWGAFFFTVGWGAFRVKSTSHGKSLPKACCLFLPPNGADAREARPE